VGRRQLPDCVEIESDFSTQHHRHPLATLGRPAIQTQGLLIDIKNEIRFLKSQLPVTIHSFYAHYHRDVPSGMTWHRHSVESSTRFIMKAEPRSKSDTSYFGIPVSATTAFDDQSGYKRSWHERCNSFQDMIAVETKTIAPKTSRSSLPTTLEIRFQFVDGSAETFVQSDGKQSENILNAINPFHLFNQSRVVIADDYSKSVFVCSQINRIDFVYDGDGFANIPYDHADLVEVSEAEFRRHVSQKNPGRLEKRKQRRRVGDLLISFLDLRMRGGRHVYLMNEILVKLPADSQSYMQRLLSKGTLVIRLADGGQSYLNLANLIGYSVYPGVAEVPADSWMAQPKPMNQ
jgi:hypothetical protein